MHDTTERADIGTTSLSRLGDCSRALLLGLRTRGHPSEHDLARAFEGAGIDLDIGFAGLPDVSAGAHDLVIVIGGSRRARVVALAIGTPILTVDSIPELLAILADGRELRTSRQWALPIRIDASRRSVAFEQLQFESTALAVPIELSHAGKTLQLTFATFGPTGTDDASSSPNSPSDTSTWRGERLDGESIVTPLLPGATASVRCASPREQLRIDVDYGRIRSIANQATVGPASALDVVRSVTSVEHGH